MYFQDSSLQLYLLCSQNHVLLLAIFLIVENLLFSVHEVSEWYFKHLSVYIKRCNCSLSFPFSSLFLHFPFLHLSSWGKPWYILYLCTKCCSALNVNPNQKSRNKSGWFLAVVDPKSKYIYRNISCIQCL